MEPVIIGFIFQLTVTTMMRSGTHIEQTFLLECPSVQVMEELEDKFKTARFRVYVDCERYKGGRCDRSAIAATGADQRACREDY